MKKYSILLLTGIFIITACSSSKKSDPTPNPPQQAVLVSPAQNELCNQGASVTAGESSVTFQWSNAANANNFVLNIKNLLTGAQTTQSTTGTQLAVTLAVNTPYAWSVISGSTKTTVTAISQTWKFYNSGPGTVNYAPFPAELVLPAMNGSVGTLNGNVSLSWNGNDVDNDTLTYDLYFDTSSVPTLLKSGLTVSQYDVSVSAGVTYYWKIVTKDASGNTSESAVSKFTVKQ